MSLYMDRLQKITGRVFPLLAVCLLLSAFPRSSYAWTPQRIISLAPNVTEMLYALGLGDKIVGVTDYCDYPPEAKKKARIGGMSNPSLEAVVALKPDIVILTTDGNPKEFRDRLTALRIRTYVVEARRIRDLPKGMRELGAVLGVPGKAESFAAATEEALKKYSMRPVRQPQQKVLFVVWPEPLIAAGPGTVIDDAINLIGGVNMAGKAKAVYPKYSVEDILRTSPDLIIIGKGMMDVKKVSEGLLKRIKILPAVKNNRVFFVSDDLYRLGPRTIRGIEEIAALIDGFRDGLGDRPVEKQ